MVGMEASPAGRGAVREGQGKSGSWQVVNSQAHKIHNTQDVMKIEEALTSQPLPSRDPRCADWHDSLFFVLLQKLSDVTAHHVLEP